MGIVILMSFEIKHQTHLKQSLERGKGDGGRQRKREGGRVRDVKASIIQPSNVKSLERKPRWNEF